MNWIDSHCHLEMIDQDTAEVLAKSKSMGVSPVVTIGTCYKNNQQLLQLLSKYEDVYGTLGLHPNHVNEDEIKHIADFKDHILSNDKIVAVGECGFDQFYDDSVDEKQQKLAFEMQLDLAMEMNYPLIVHSRQADQLTIDALEPYLKKGLRVILHCFTAGQELFDFGLQYGTWFSFNAIATFPKSDALRAIFKQTPLDKILLETDAPFLSPAPFRGKTNIPGYVSIVANKLAEVINLQPEQFQKITVQNTKEFYRLP